MVQSEEEEEDDKGEPPAEGDAGKKKKPRKKKKKAKEVEAEGADARDAHFDGYDDGPELDVSSVKPEDWLDITDLCALASKGMQLGEMIESPQFRLFDAMSAIEIMDPKMDSGFNSEADMTLERAAEQGILAQSLSLEEHVAIWDRLLMYYLLWMEGHTLVQTCFCCLYLQDPARHAKPLPLLGAFVDAFLVACRTAREIVLKAGIFEDEDFLPALFGIDLDTAVFSTSPTEVKERLDRERKALKGSPAGKAAAEAAAARLEFIGEYSLALSELHSASEVSGAGAAKNAKKRQESAQKRLTACLGLLEKLEQTSVAPPPDALRCFDPSINRKLLVPGPPRTVAPMEDTKVVLGMWNSHIHELLLCGSLPQKPLMLILEGAVDHKGEPNVLPRSVAHLRAGEDGLLRTLMMDNLEAHLFPREALQHCKKPAEAFVQHSELLFMHLVKLAHKNHARRFRQLAHCFSDFNALQHEAWQLDEDLKKTFGANLRHLRPCWIWVMEHCLQMMISKLLLGFELELYDEAEFHMIYWYVDYLYGLRIYNLNELYHAKEQPVGGPKSKPGQRGKKDAPVTRGGQRPKNPPASLLLLEATQSMVRGLFRLLAFTLKLGMLKAPPNASAGLAQRFVLRFRSLEHFRLPHLPSFRDFEQSSATAEAPLESRVVLDAAQASFTEAALLLDRAAAKEKEGKDEADSLPQLEDAKKLRRVLVANQLAATQLLKASVDTPAKVVTTLAYHPSLVTVQVTLGKDAAPAKGGYPEAAAGDAAAEKTVG